MSDASLPIQFDFNIYKVAQADLTALVVFNDRECMGVMRADGRRLSQFKWTSLSETGYLDDLAERKADALLASADADAEDGEDGDFDVIGAY